MEIRKTADGSETLFSPEFGETYHSINGAITESEHVFIHTGMNFSRANPASILEIGFGTGLNAYLTYLDAQQKNRCCVYTALELYPVEEGDYQQLSKCETIVDKELFLSLHRAAWGKPTVFDPTFSIQKFTVDFLNHNYGEKVFDVVFFDAFSPASQPELWTEELFGKIYRAMRDNGVLTTYCAKGQVRRNLKSAGFLVERLPGPPGKREMLRAVKRDVE